MSSTAAADAASDPSADKVAAGASVGGVHIPPDILSAIRNSLKDDLVQMCHQACQQALNAKENQSSSSPVSNSTPHLPKKRPHDRDDGGRCPWLTKAPKKHLAQQPAQRHSDSDETSQDEEDDDDSEPFSDTEEQEPDPEQEDSIARYFNAEDYQQLLTKCLSSLDLKDKTRSSSGKVFPFPIFFEQQLRAEWETPAMYKRPPAKVRKLYSLPKFTEDFLKVPPVDAPILAIQSSGLLTQDGQGSLRDSWDKKIDLDLRHAYESSALAIGSTATASIVARAAIAWGRKLMDLLPHADSRIREGLSRLIMANSFIADATLDNLVFTSRSMAAGVHARRAIWLRAWQADPKSKQIVAAYPFTGDKLFGTHLDKILVETREKKKVLPKSLRRPDKRGSQPFQTTNYSFRSSFQPARTRTDGRRVTWTPKPRFRRPFFNPRANRGSFLRNQDRTFCQDGAGPQKRKA